MLSSEDKILIKKPVGMHKIFCSKTDKFLWLTVHLYCTCSSFFLILEWHPQRSLNGSQPNFATCSKVSQIWKWWSNFGVSSS